MRTINRDRHENIVNKETRQKRYSQIKHVRESISGNKDVNIVSIIHDAAEAINTRVIKDMGIKDKDFVIRYTPYGLWITWNSNDYYGIRVCCNSDSYIEIRSQDDQRTVNEITMEWQSHPARIASAIMQIVNEDGYLD